MPANFETGWFAPLWDYPICFVDHRIRFSSPDNNGNAPVSRNTFIYFGPNEARFVEVFSRIGTVIKRVGTGAPKSGQLDLLSGK